MIKEEGFMFKNFKKNRVGQLTIFVIIAIILLAAVGGYFIFRSNFNPTTLSSEMQPVYDNFLLCLEEETKTGINLLESQGGYIYVSELEFEPGSQFSPFSSMLNFLGNPIPYWYYVSGNNIPKEQIPSMENMEEDLEIFLEERIDKCRFDSFYENGFSVIQDVENIESRIEIDDNVVNVKINMGFEISRGEETALVRNHEVIVGSDLGKLYSDALEIYEYEQEDLFLENYAVDILRLYAPVDGVEIDCSPLVWNAEEVFDDLEEAIEANTVALRTPGGNYELNTEYSKYFIVDVPVDSEVRFLNSQNWPNSFSVSPSQGPVLMAEPVGNQQGLGILGFCYVPYHFVYDMKYPVLVQVYGYSDMGMEIFQFPLAVVIEGNVPREALDASAVGGNAEIEDFCIYNNSVVSVNVYDTNLNSVEADIYYECSGTSCYIGKTDSVSGLTTGFPDCVNGRLVAEAPSYENGGEIFSSVEGGSVEIILEREYELDVNLNLGEGNLNSATISFDKNGSGSKVIFYPDQKIVNLSEGQYEIKVMAYRDSSLRLQGQTYEQCVEVSRSGIGSLIGLTKEECYDVEIPATNIENALAGGGSQNYYILESELQSGKINIVGENLPMPVSLEQLQKNYEIFEGQSLEVSFG